ncbi:MAG: Ig-like domain-containing protein, partial [Verrucomicrobiales bacterium]|nr:Ig-like domain-containing protein [Verrucomicrobiales bacterium]
MRPNCLALIAVAFLPVGSIAKPFASPDSLTAFEDSELVTTVSILDNDTSGGPDLTAALLTPPAHGILTLSNNGTLTYIPNPNFHGSDEFSYIAQETDDRPVTFIVDQARSQVEFTATVNDPDLGSRTDTDTSAISGTAALQLDPARPPLDDVQITDFELTLADGADLSFNYGFFIGSLNVDIADNGLTIAMENPGPRSSIDTENKFSQSDNDVRITGATEISASGTIALIFEDTTLDVDAVESVDITDAQVVELDGTLTVTLPINFASTLPVDDTRTVDVTLYGQVVATATVPPLPVDSEPATVTITVAPADDGPLAIHDTFTTPVGQTLTRGTATGLLANDI